MVPFMTSYYALEDTKKKAVKYFLKLFEFTALQKGIET